MLPSSSRPKHLRLPCVLPPVHLYFRGTAAWRSTSGGISNATASAAVGSGSPDHVTCMQPRKLASKLGLCLHYEHGRQHQQRHRICCCGVWEP